MDKIYMASMVKKINGVIRCEEVEAKPRPKGGIFHLIPGGYLIIEELDVVRLTLPENHRGHRAVVYSRSEHEAIRILKEYKAELEPNRSAIRRD